MMYPLPPQMPQANPMAAIMQAVASGQDPAAMIRQMAAQDPRASMALQLMQGKRPDQIRTVVENMARERGVDLNQMVQELQRYQPPHR